MGESVAAGRHNTGAVAGSLHVETTIRQTDRQKRERKTEPEKERGVFSI